MNQQGKKQVGSSAGWIVLVFSVLLVIAAYIPYAYTERISDEIWTFRFLYGFTLLGILPAGVVFYLSELWMKRSPGFGKKKLPAWQSILYGVIVGFFLAFIAEFLVWKYLYPTLFAYRVPFWDFLFPENPFDLRKLILTNNPFFTISIINIIAASCLGWKMNRNRS